MNKDEILEKSRRENSNGDEWQKDVALKGYRVAGIATAILLGIFCIAKHDIGYLIVIWLGDLFRSIYNAVKFKRVADFILVIVEVVLCVIWIYNYVRGVW